VINRADPRTVGTWSFGVQEIRGQRAGVTILNNVIDPRLGEQTRVVYALAQGGPVSIVVADLRGAIVTVLYRGTQEAGEYWASWDGRNRGLRSVAPGMYFIKVVGPGINEIRKVSVVDRSR
jgi:hypothetical protein